MPDEENQPDQPSDRDADQAVTDPPAPAQATKTKEKETPARTPPKQLPPYKLLLHNDDENSMDRVVMVVVKLTPLSMEQAIQKMLEAHSAGLTLLLVTHKERAELYQEQFASAGLTTTIEPA